MMGGQKSCWCSQTSSGVLYVVFPCVFRMLLVAVPLLNDVTAFAGASAYAGIPTLLTAVNQENSAGKDDELPPLTEMTFISSLDQSKQPLLLHVPESATERKTPILVFLHSWSGDYRQNNSTWLREAVSRGWIYLHPNFRGRNDHPEACGSRLARQDILDALDLMSSRFQLDPERIYLAGVSGGGHMSMLMAGHHPDRFSAISAWVGINDLEDWHQFHLKKNMENGYHRMIEASLGGAPGVSPERDADYRDRSPIHWLHRTGDLPVELAAGVHDGHTGSVPVSHSLRAFNVIARAGGYATVTDDELTQLTENRLLENPMPSDVASDDTLGRKIHLRRSAGVSRVTVFEGGHEGLPVAACSWLQQQRRRAKLAATGN